MGQESAFFPTTAAYLIDSAAWYQVPTVNSVSNTAYRIRNVSGAAPYIAYYPGLVAAPTVAAPVAPVVGTPSPNTIGMQVGGVETFMLPPNAWFRAAAATTFEIEGGEGI